MKNPYPVSTCFGLGNLRIAPGTWGSLPPVVLFMAIATLLPVAAAGAVMAVLAVLSSWACVAWSPAVIHQTGRKDPRQVVSDEVAGQALALAIISIVHPPNLCIAASGTFLLFRFFDILKCWPMSRLEKLPMGWGILADDLAAGVLAGAVYLAAYYTGLLDKMAGVMHCAGPLNENSAILLGVVQGLTEFLPVSSSGHLVLFEDLLPDIDPDSPQMLLFDLAIHVGTVGAIAVIYFKSLIELVRNLIKAPGQSLNPVVLYRKNPAVHILFLAFVTTVVTFVLYKFLKTPLESARKLPLVAGMWLITGTLLLVTDLRVKTRVSLRRFGILAAVIVGIAQTAAILPGISRSGATICTAILLGLHRRWAIEYSFLIGIPAILGGAVIKFFEEYQNLTADTLPVQALVIGMAAAFFSGIIALKILINTSRNKKLKYFAFYCYFLSLAVAGYLLIGK